MGVRCGPGRSAVQVTAGSSNGRDPEELALRVVARRAARCRRPRRRPHRSAGPARPRWSRRRGDLGLAEAPGDAAGADGADPADEVLAGGRRLVRVEPAQRPDQHPGQPPGADEGGGQHRAGQERAGRAVQPAAVERGGPGQAQEPGEGRRAASSTTVTGTPSSPAAASTPVPPVRRPEPWWAAWWLP